MDFIETIFGISPDAGSGAFELVLIVIPVLILVSIAAYRRWRRANRTSLHANHLAQHNVLYVRLLEEKTRNGI
jgi:hypothetical protein